MNLVPVIMCGGSGTRLWPLSRKNYPKQFVPLFEQPGKETLFHRTIARIACFDCQHVIVVCHDTQRFFVANSLHNTKIENTILVEPKQQGTAPAATLAALAAVSQFGEALLLIMPADHIIDDVGALRIAIDTATVAAQQDHIVVFGVLPSRVETGYGYVHTIADTKQSGGVLKVIEFCEKPSQQTANEWIARGNCYWNSGMFLVKASVYLDAIARFEPTIKQGCEQAWEKRYYDLGFTHVDADSFAQCRDIAIDYAVIERVDNLMLMPTNMGWNDVGSWDALGSVFTAADNHNRVKGDVILKEASNNVVYSHNKLVSVLGVDDCIVVDTADAVLVASKKHAQQVKELVNDMQREHRNEADESHEVFRPWGSYESIDQADCFQVKRITVNPGQVLSLQMHHHRSEHWVVVQGRARVTLGDQIFILEANQSTYIPVQTKHRLENIGDQPLCLIEVQCGDYFGEDDIVRFADRYGRTKP